MTTQKNTDGMFTSPPLHLSGKKDNIFETGPYPKPFEFNLDVATVFDDMVSRSVPLYREVNQALLEWVFWHTEPHACVYDIGCSTGTALSSIAHGIKHPLRLIGVDPSAAMICEANQKLASMPQRHSLELRQGDALSQSYENAAFVIMNYTLQFIPVAKREPLLRKIFSAMTANGVVFLSEKVRASSPQIQETSTRIYENFKLQAGYSATEIARKKEALDNVLVPLSVEEQIDMLKRVGFKYVEPIIRWHSFVTYIAIR